MKPEHKPIFEALDPCQLLGINIHREAAGEPYEGKVAVGTVVLERVDHRNWDGKTVHEVILKPWQFSWTMPEAGPDYYNASVNIAKDWHKAYKNSAVLQECYRVAKGLLDGTIPRDPDLAAVNCTEYVETNFRRSADRQADGLLWRIQNGEKGLWGKYARLQRSRWWTAMRIVKQIAHHEFYVPKDN